MLTEYTIEYCSAVQPELSQFFEMNKNRSTSIAGKLEVVQDEFDAVIDVRDYVDIDLDSICLIRSTAAGLKKTGKRVKVLCLDKPGYRHICRLLELFSMNFKYSKMAG